MEKEWIEMCYYLAMVIFGALAFVSYGLFIVYVDIRQLIMAILFAAMFIMAILRFRQVTK